LTDLAQIVRRAAPPHKAARLTPLFADESPSSIIHGFHVSTRPASFFAATPQAGGSLLVIRSCNLVACNCVTPAIRPEDRLPFELADASRGSMNVKTEIELRDERP
jgi:hypothetical protein